MAKFLWLSALAACVGLAADHPALNGTWQNGDETLSIHQDADAIQISRVVTHAAGKSSTVDIQCNTVGKACKLKDDGEPAEITMYYNGPMLVMLEVRRNNQLVIKKRLKPSDDGKKLTVEVMHIEPQQKTETATYIRQ